MSLYRDFYAVTDVCSLEDRLNFNRFVVYPISDLVAVWTLDQIQLCASFSQILKKLVQGNNFYISLKTKNWIVNLNFRFQQIFFGLFWVTIKNVLLCQLFQRSHDLISDQILSSLFNFIKFHGRLLGSINDFHVTSKRNW